MLKSLTDFQKEVLKKRDKSKVTKHLIILFVLSKGDNLQI